MTTTQEKHMRNAEHKNITGQDSTDANKRLTQKYNVEDDDEQQRTCIKAAYYDNMTFIQRKVFTLHLDSLLPATLQVGNKDVVCAASLESRSP